MKNIAAPSSVLHISNLYEGCTEEELRKLFGQDQAGAPGCQFFEKDRKMAFIRMDSVEDAAHALMKLHNYKLGDKYMRVSFSNRDPSRVGDSDGGARGLHHEEL
jgi:RNA recognition motif-containing protein